MTFAGAFAKVIGLLRSDVFGVEYQSLYIMAVLFCAAIKVYKSITQLIV